MNDVNNVNKKSQDVNKKVIKIPVMLILAVISAIELLTLLYLAMVVL